MTRYKDGCFNIIRGQFHKKDRKMFFVYASSNRTSIQIIEKKYLTQLKKTNHQLLQRFQYSSLNNLNKQTKIGKNLEDVNDTSNKVNTKNINNTP